MLVPGEPGYADAAPLWNGAHDSSAPALIVRCAGAVDVIAAVGFARSHGLPLAVRGGGHSRGRFSTSDGRNPRQTCQLMNEVIVRPRDPARDRGRRRAPGRCDHETQAHGLATTGGLISSTAVGGFTLGGGLGWTMRKFGLACDDLVGADVVTADGRLLHASETENADLLWGLRGGGGNFGIVTRFELALYPLGPIIYAGPIFYPAEEAFDLLRVFRDWAADAPDEITALVNLTSAPPLPPIPQEWHGRKVAALVAASTGPVDEGEVLVRRIRSVAEPISDLLGPMPFVLNAVTGWQDPEEGPAHQDWAQPQHRAGAQLVTRVRTAARPEGRRGTRRLPSARRPRATRGHATRSAHAVRPSVAINRTRLLERRPTARRSASHPGSPASAERGERSGAAFADREPGARELADRLRRLGVGDRDRAVDPVAERGPRGRRDLGAVEAGHSRGPASA